MAGNRGKCRVRTRPVASNAFTPRIGQGLISRLQSFGKVSYPSASAPFVDPGLRGLVVAIERGRVQRPACLRPRQREPVGRDPRSALSRTRRCAPVEVAVE